VALTERIRSIHERSWGTYGTPRVHAELSEQGERVSRKRVARLMKEAGLQGVSRRRGVRTTVRGPESRPAPDLVERDFSAPGPDRLWVADITYIATWAGFLYLSVVLDAWSRKVVGWAMATHLRTQLVLDALDMALWQRRPREVIHHSDQGTQYTSIAFGQRCREAGVRPSMGSVGDAYDNALCESFFATLECELLDRRRFRTQAEARMAVFEFLEGFYNPQRRHSALGYLSPINYERRMDVAI
jgi:putative transposase